MGATDCTHVPIKAPNDNEHLFVNGKQHHSLNIQVVANSEHYILIMCVPHTLAALMMHSYGATLTFVRDSRMETLETRSTW